MADDLVPYPDLPDSSSPSDAALAVDRSNANWAKTFERGTTNLAQRARHSQDIRTYTADLETRRTEEAAKRLATNKDAQNFYIRSKTLQLNEEKAHFDMADKMKKAKAAEDMAPLMFKAKEAQTNATIANAARTAAQTEAQAKISAAADAYHAGVATAQSLYAPDSPEYERAIVDIGNANGIARHDPAVNAQFMAAQKSLTARAAIADKAKADAAKAEETRTQAENLGLPANSVSKAGVVYRNPPAGKTGHAPVDPELSALNKKLASAVATQITAGTLSEPELLALPDSDPRKKKQQAYQFQPGIDRLKAAIAERTPAASPFKEGETRVKDGTTYKRDANGVWHPQH